MNTDTQIMKVFAFSATTVPHQKKIGGIFRPNHRDNLSRPISPCDRELVFYNENISSFLQ